MGNLLTATLPCALHFSIVMLSASASLESSQSTLKAKYEEFDNLLNECQLPALKDRCSPTAVCDLTKDFCYEADHFEFSSCKSCIESCSLHPDHTAYKERCQGPPCEYYQYNICHNEQKEALLKLFKSVIDLSSSENAPENPASLKVSIAFNVILGVLSIVLGGVLLRGKFCRQNTAASPPTLVTHNEQAVIMPALTDPNAETGHLLAGGDATLPQTANLNTNSTNGFNHSNGEVMGRQPPGPDISLSAPRVGLSEPSQDSSASRVGPSEPGQDPSASRVIPPEPSQEPKGPFGQPEAYPAALPNYCRPMNTDTFDNELDQPLSLHSSESMMPRGPPTGLPVEAEHQAHGGDDNVDLVKPHDGQELHVGSRGHYEHEAAYQPSDNQSDSTSPKKV